VTDERQVGGDGRDVSDAGSDSRDNASAMRDMLAQLEEVRRESAELLDSLQRSRAEFVNFRRRVEQDREVARQRAHDEIVRKLLPIADDFDRALRMVPDEVAANSWFEGVQLVERKLWNVLASEGVEVMESVGKPFDPTRHEAVMVDEGAPGADTVVEEFQRGYLVNGSVLRPAMVKVGAAEQPASAS
jgi:molecular chaperone GrpE